MRWIIHLHDPRSFYATCPSCGNKYCMQVKRNWICYIEYIVWNLKFYLCFNQSENHSNIREAFADFYIQKFILFFHIVFITFQFPSSPHFSQQRQLFMLASKPWVHARSTFLFHDRFHSWNHSRDVIVHNILAWVECGACEVKLIHTLFSSNSFLIFFTFTESW